MENDWLKIHMVLRLAWNQNGVANSLDHEKGESIKTGSNLRVSFTFDLIVYYAFKDWKIEEIFLSSGSAS